VSNYRVALSSSATRELERLPAKLIYRIVPHLERLATNPRPNGCKKLSGGDREWRIRVGDYRIIHEIDDSARTVDVVRIRHRREVYN